MEQYLIDTNVVSDYLSASLSKVGMDFLDTVIDTIPNLSVISKIELLCWKTDKITTEGVKNFVADSIILDIAPNVISYCVAVRKSKKIKTPDAIIAATALAHGYILITNNEKDFLNIKGLKIINPHKM
ncbi:MAG TPA: type II toxin-antitoxin system VapC family toxin [Chitinophagales bacterium]|nr:type II toxin-antitoxin system VapC family toxin [Chitinophagales bacterium]MCB0511506.1 type II toxin-antitoxin system VapC family toxin [Bacteroidota bacterium]HMU98054.1 type II toxin-antitoxin system VapC family toxin [Chitinophagales bacterium]HMV03544.1 type II toxin-antitoxin system VapC family toxin [Chitinophagales bacterium]HMW94575.1 type II toxin-antitoxin system VapC family toxin [Chitinophagales bacterium]